MADGVATRVRTRKPASPDPAPPAPPSQPSEPKVLKLTNKDGPRPITAAARRINLTTRNGRKLLDASPQRWQDEAWAYFGTLPEVSFAAGFLGNAMSRVRWFPAVTVAADEPPVPLEDAEGIPDGLAEAAREELDRISNDRDGMAGIKRDFGINLSIAGEAYLVNRPAEADEEDQEPGDLWGVYSSASLKPRGDKVFLQETPGSKRIELPEDTLVYRIWRRDPQWPGWAWSNMKASLDTAEELLLHSRTLRAIAKSGANAGALLVPTEMDPPPRSRANPDDTSETDPTAPGEGEQMTEMERAFVEWMTTAVEDDGSPTQVAPPILRGAYQYLDRVRHLMFARPIDDKLIERIEHLIDRLAHGMDIPVEILKGAGDANHWCHDVSTEIYTRDQGWVTHDRLSVGDVVLTLNHETGESEWQPVLDIYRADVADEPMLSMESECHSSLSTVGHRWPIVKTGRKVGGSRRRWTTSKDGFAATDRVPVAASSCDLPTEPKWDDDFVRLMAAWTSDGAVLRYQSGTEHGRIVKFADAEIAELRRVMHRVFGPSGWAEHEHPTSTCTGRSFVMGHDAYRTLADVTGDHKAITRQFVHQLTYAQRLLLLDSMLDLGDGVARDGASTFFQVEPSRLDALELAAITTGHKVTRGIRNEQTGFGTTPLSWIRIAKRRDSFAPYYAAREWTTYNGTVWCPTTPNSTWFARRNGTSYWTGNSLWAIQDDTYKAHVEPTDQIAAQGVAYSFLRPALLERGFTAEQVRKVVIGLDPSALVVRPNRAADAKDAHDRGALSDDAFLSALGFSDGDKPSDEEIVRRLALRRGSISPKLTAALLEQSGLASDLPEDLDNNGRSTSDTPDDGNDPVEGGEPTPISSGEGGQPSLTAAVPVSEITGTLASLEPRLQERLTVAASAAVTEAVRKAGSRIRGATQGHPALAERVNGQPPEDVGRILGPLVVAELADMDRLLDGAFDGLAAQWDTWVGQAQSQVASALTRHVEAAPNPAEAEVALASYQGQADSDRDAGWVVLAGLLVAHTRELIFGQSDEMIDGEFDPSVSVPYGLPREALARAGGQPGLRPAGTVAAIAGLTTGPRVLALLAGFGLGVQRWRWVTGVPAHPFEPHQRLEGVEFDRPDDPQLANPSTWPPVGFLAPGDHKGCFVAGTPVSGPPAHTSFARHYEGTCVKVTTKSGKQFTATPNHPVFTDGGWVAAGDLNVGDEVISQLLAEGPGTVGPDDRQMPARIEDVAATLPMTGSVDAVTVPVASEEFHGDGAGSQVCVVRADRGLLIDREPPRTEPVSDHELVGVGGGHGALPADGHPVGLVGGSDTSTRGFVSGSGPGGPLLGGELGEIGPVDGLPVAQRNSGVFEAVDDDRATDPVLRRELTGGFASEVAAGQLLDVEVDSVVGSVADGGELDPSLDEPLADGLGAYAEPSSDDVARFAGLVGPDEVVDIERDWFSGHVYNLSTSTGWYLADGILVHNCQCNAIPVVATLSAEQAA